MTRVEVKCSPVKGLKMMGTTLKLPPHLTMVHLHKAIRGRIRSLRPDEAIFLFVNGKHCIPMSRRLDHVVNEHGIDGILHVSVHAESTFGAYSIGC
jgi:hypothetical protein